MTKTQCQKFKCFKIILFSVFIFISGTKLFSNDLPVMLDEVIDIQITKLPGLTHSTGPANYQATVKGSYLFTQDKPGKTTMLYPVPNRSRNISVKVNGTGCAIKPLDYTWPTGIGGYPAFAFTTDPDSLPFELEVCYTHDIPQDKNLNTFLYPLIFNRDEGDTTETTIAFHVTLPKEISLYKTFLGEESIEPDVQCCDKIKRVSYQFVNNNPRYTMDFKVVFSLDNSSDEVDLNNIKRLIKLLKTNIMQVIKYIIRGSCKTEVLQGL